MDKYDYIPGYCPKLQYKGMWPCRFSEKDGVYVKQEMICSNGGSGCMGTCPLFAQIPEVYPHTKEWLLMDISAR